MAEPSFLTRLKQMILVEALRAQGFMRLLMKPRNGIPWTAEDKALLRLYLRSLARSVPALAVISLPGGSLLLPLLAWFLDRRRQRRTRRPARASP